MGAATAGLKKRQQHNANRRFLFYVRKKTAKEEKAKAKPREGSKGVQHRHLINSFTTFDFFRVYE